MKTITRFISFLVFIAATACTSPDTITGYYFDPVNGDDANDGTSAKTAFRTFAKLRELNVKGGGYILLKSGAVFSEPFFFSGKGNDDAFIFIDKYGGEEKPHIKVGGHNDVAVLEGRSTRNIYEDNYFTGPLEVAFAGFTPYNDFFGKQLWYDEADENRNKQIDFVKDKTVPLFGKEVPVFDIIGWN
jgi:hypothetical protein